MGKFISICLALLVLMPAVVVHGSEMSVFGQKQYVRTTGAPNVYLESFSAISGEALLVIRNGSEVQGNGKSDRVSSANIYLNGIAILGPADFKQQEHLIRIPITLLDLNELQIELASIPDSFLTIGIVQDLALDLAVSQVRIDSSACPDSALISFRISNYGEGIIPGGTAAGIYLGDPAVNGTLVGAVATSIALRPGEFEDVAFRWTSPGTDPGVLYVRIDDENLYAEVDEQNNVASLESEFCWTLPPNIESIGGRIIDAVTGALLADTEAVLHQDENGLPGTVARTVRSDAEGHFVFSNLYPGSYIITVNVDGYLPGEKPVLLPAGAILENQDVVLSPVLSEDQIRIVLTWGEKPEDLEAHLTAPNPAGCRHHCFYWNKEIPGANLDLDDRHSYGPETITITEQSPGTYRYYVHDFTNRAYTSSSWLSRSGAQVKIYQGSRPPLVFTVPNQSGTVWHVFDLDGETGRITPVHKMTYQDEPGRIDFPVITSGLVNSAYWGQPYTSQVSAYDPDNDPLAYSLLEAPAGMTINPESGLIEWTPSGTQKGRYYVTIKVADGRCGEDTYRNSIYEYFQPGAQFSVSPCSGTNSDGDVTLSWTTSLAETVFIDQGIGLVEPNGSKTIPSPDPPVVYTLTAANGAAQTVRTTPILPSPGISFSPSSILRGNSTLMSWGGGCANRCEINNGVGEVPVSGSMTLTPPATTLYTITCANAAGSRTYSRYIYVNDPPPPPPPPPPPSPNTTFSVSPTCAWSAGDPITLSWTSQNTTSCSISPDVGSVGLNGSVTVNPTGTTTYSLVCSGAGGAKTRSIIVPQAPSASLYVAPNNYSTYYMDLGNSAELRWSTTCADTITLNNGIGTVASSGSMVVTPAQLPLTYTVTAVNERSTATSSVTLRQIAPTATFSADPALIKVGEGATLSWTTTRATSCSISPEVGPVDCGGGSVTVHPAVPITYKLTATGSGGTVTRNATVGFVKPVADIEANPGTINEGERATLQWIFSNATTAVINQGIGEVQLGQTLEVSPAVTTTYAMTATGPGGTATDSVTITVIPANPPPVASISAAPLFIMKGESSVLSWSSANADTVTIDQGMGNVGVSGSIPVSPEQTTIYTLTATGPGGTRTADVKVTVLHPLPAITFTGMPETIMFGDTAVLNWSVIGAQSVSIDQGIGAVTLEGTLEVSPTSTTTYRLTATGPGGTAGKTVTVTVLHDPPTASLSVEPDSVAKGSSTQLTWSSAYADACSITPDIGPVECNGTATVTPADTTTYSFIANGPGGSVSKTVTVTVMHPVPVITAYADPATIQPGESTILNWISFDAYSVTIDQDLGEQPANGQVTVTPAATTTYTITATGPGGTASGTVTVTVAEPSPITLTITSPANDQTITRPEVMVTGTVSHANGLEIGVVVNGIAAAIYNGTFIANHVPLIEGENTILVVATDAEGKTMQKSVTVTAPPITDAVMVGCNYALGIAPLNATLVVASSFTLNSAPSFSYIGPGDVVFTQNGDLESRDISISAPGIYYFTAELSDEKGALYSADVAVVVLDRQQLDFQLKAKWNDLKAALVSGNIQDALALHHPSVRSEYETIYTALGDRFMALVGQMQDIELIFAENGRAQYRIRKEQIIDGKAEIITYYIYFYLDGGGIWRLENY